MTTKTLKQKAELYMDVGPDPHTMNCLDYNYTTQSVVSVPAEEHPDIKSLNHSFTSGSLGTYHTDGLVNKMAISNTIPTGNGDSSDAILFEDAWTISIPGAAEYIGELDYQLTVPSPYKILSDAVLAWALKSNNVWAFKYTAMVTSGLGLTSVRPVIRFACQSVDKPSMVKLDRDCRLSFYKGIPRPPRRVSQISLSDDDIEVV